MSLLPPIELINNVALLLGLAVLYDLTLQSRRSQQVAPRLLYGIVIGGMGIAVMLTPWPVAPGIVYDTRSILLSITGLFFGAAPTLVAMAMTAVFRFQQGGAGMWAGIAVIFASGLLGLGWRYRRRQQNGASTIPWVQFYLFGIVVHVVMLLLQGLLLPYPASMVVLSQITVPVLILYPIGAVLLGLVLQRQRERELTYEAVQEREERLQLALDAAGMGAWDWDIAANRVVWDVFTFKLAGISADEFGGKIEDFLSIVHPADRKGVEEAFVEASQLKQEYQKEFRILRRDGQIRWVAVYGRVIHGKHRLVGVVRDITQRRQAEAALRLSRFAVDNAAAGMVVVAHNGRLADVNREECRRLGYTREEMLQKYVWDLAPTFSKEDWPAHWQKVKNAGQLRFETKYLTHTGAEIFLEISASYIRFEGEEYYYAFSLDVTRQRQIEGQLHQAQKMEAMGRLAGSIAHDFNNLLVPIIGFAEMAMVQPAADAKQLHYLAQIRDSANRAAAITGQILAFSRKQALELKVVDVNQIVINFNEILPQLIRENIRVILNLAHQPLLVEADASKLEQMLLNLAVNANDAMPNGGTFTISVEAALLKDPLRNGFTRLEPGDHVLLTVADTGEGMSAETVRHIFEPFFTTKESGKGTGLGLATVHGVIQQHKGDVMVISQPDEGATFRVALPRVQAIVPEASPPPAQPESAAAIATILIAEDEENVRSLLSELLKGSGHKVLEAVNGDESLRKVRAETGAIDLLISDIVMPGMDGVELYNRLKENNPRLKVIFMSGHTEESPATQRIKEKGYTFLQKPFSIREMQKLVEQVLAQ